MISPRYRIVRFSDTPYATYARIYRPNGSQLGVILELPWVDADHNGKRDTGKSRFMPGVYECFRRYSHKSIDPATGQPGTGHRDYDVWEYKNVPDVENAQIHRAAFPSDLRGCQGIGDHFEVRDDPNVGAKKLAMRGSPEKFEQFMLETKDYDSITVEVVDAFNQQAAA